MLSAFPLADDVLIFLFLKEFLLHINAKIALIDRTVGLDTCTVQYSTVPYKHLNKEACGTHITILNSYKKVDRSTSLSMYVETVSPFL